MAFKWSYSSSRSNAISNFSNSLFKFLISDSASSNRLSSFSSTIVSKSSRSLLRVWNLVNFSFSSLLRCKNFVATLTSSQKFSDAITFSLSSISFFNCSTFITSEISFRRFLKFSSHFTISYFSIIASFF